MSLLDWGLLARWFPFLFRFRTLAIFWQRSCHTSEKLLQMLAFQWSLLRSLKGRLLLSLAETMAFTGFWDRCPYRISFPSSFQGMEASAFRYRRKWKKSLQLFDDNKFGHVWMTPWKNWCIGLQFFFTLTQVELRRRYRSTECTVVKVFGV